MEENSKNKKWGRWIFVYIPLIVGAILFVVFVIMCLIIYFSLPTVLPAAIEALENATGALLTYGKIYEEFEKSRYKFKADMFKPGKFDFDNNSAEVDDANVLRVEIDNVNKKIMMLYTSYIISGVIKTQNGESIRFEHRQGNETSSTKMITGDTIQKILLNVLTQTIDVDKIKLFLIPNNLKPYLDNFDEHITNLFKVP